MTALEVQILYEQIYILVVSILTLLYTNKYNSRKDGLEISFNSDIKKRFPGAWILAIIIIFFIGFRPHQAFGDSSNYILVYKMNEGLPFVFDWNADNIIWDNFFLFWSSHSLGVTSLFTLVAAGYFGISLLICKRLFPKDYYLAFLVFLGAFSTFSYGTNGIKAGLAATIFIFGVSCYQKRLLSFLIVLLSMGFHHSMQLPIAAYILVLFFKSPNYFYYGWLFSLMIAVLHISFFQVLFAGLTDESGTAYLNSDGGEDTWITGMRYDFVVYSAMPIAIGYYIEMKKKLCISSIYSDMIHTYITINSIWMLCMYASYTNRIAYLSWCMYPFLIIYPFLRENVTTNQYSVLRTIVLLHVAFTLFMTFIY